MFNCFPDADARAQARVGPGLATPLGRSLSSCSKIYIYKYFSIIVRVDGYLLSNDKLFLASTCMFFMHCSIDCKPPQCGLGGANLHSSRADYVST